MTAGAHRLRVAYPKGGRLAYLGHLEVIGTIGRCVRRASLPFRVGNGFARRMTVQFSQALPAGVGSSCEYYDLTLLERVDPSLALSRLRAATPSDLAPYACAYVDPAQPALEAWLDRASWRVEVVGCPTDAEGLMGRIRALRDLGTISYLRGGREKVVDLAGTLVSVGCEPHGGDGVLVSLDARSGSSGSLRPRVLLDAALVEGGYRTLRVRRVGQWHEGEDGSLVEPL